MRISDFSKVDKIKISILASVFLLACFLIFSNQRRFYQEINEIFRGRFPPLKRLEEAIPEEERMIPEEFIAALETEGPVVKIDDTGFDQKEVILEKGKNISLVNYREKPVKIKSTDVYQFEIDSKGAVSLPLERNLEFFIEDQPEERLKVIVE